MADTTVETTTAGATGEVAGEAKPKKKKKYTRALKGVQKVERGAAKAQLRLASAIVAGIETWEKNRDKSASKKRDGAIRDALTNGARAYGRAVRVASKAGTDFVESVQPMIWNPKFMRRMVFPFGS